MRTLKNRKTLRTPETEFAARARTFRLPETTTPENIASRWGTTLDFQNKVLVAGHHYNGVNQNSFFGAVYTYIDDNLTCEGEVRLTAISDEFFPDNGTAIAWALKQ